MYSYSLHHRCQTHSLWGWFQPASLCYPAQHFVSTQQCQAPCSQAPSSMLVTWCVMGIVLQEHGVWMSLTDLHYRIITAIVMVRENAFWDCSVHRTNRPCRREHSKVVKITLLCLFFPEVFIILPAVYCIITWCQHFPLLLVLSGIF